MRFRKALLPILLISCSAGAGAADTYVVDPSHSQVGFSVTHMVISKVHGEFTNYSGEITLDGKDLSTVALKGSIKVASVDTDDHKRDAHLREEDFFHVEEFPEITFESTGVEKKKKGKEHILVGRLTMRGETKHVRIPFEIKGPITDPWGNSRLGFEASLTIDRRDFGVSFSRTLDTGGLVVGNEVEIELSGEAVKKKE